MCGFKNILFSGIAIMSGIAFLFFARLHAGWGGGRSHETRQHGGATDHTRGTERRSAWGRGRGDVETAHERLGVGSAGAWGVGIGGDIHGHTQAPRRAGVHLHRQPGSLSI